MSFPILHSQSDPNIAVFGANPENFNFNTLVTSLNQIADYAVGMVLGVAAIVLIIIAYMFITSQGNQQQLETAKKGLLGLIVGVVVVLGSYIIIKVIQSTLT
ncbi:hypothetical protein KC644_03135 [Candidatus Berkelbacteria bacterium]|nr:hypothetical protein [Candidatus Berkelbacteria bacterium]